jgi:hypothetical protein
MKKNFISLIIISFNLISVQHIFAQQNVISSLQSIISNSELTSGLISFEKKGIYYEYQYKDSLSLIRVLDFPNEKRIIVYFDTQSTDFNIFNIKVGLIESEVKEILREFGNPRIKNTEYGFYFEYVIGGYWLIIEFVEEKISRIYYNPFE